MRTSAYENFLCLTKQRLPGIHCPDFWVTYDNLPQFLKDPSEIKNEMIVDLGVSEKYGCAITSQNDLVCFGEPSFASDIRNIKAKSVSVSREIMCYIDINDHLGCAVIKVDTN